MATNTDYRKYRKEKEEIAERLQETLQKFIDGLNMPQFKSINIKATMSLVWEDYDTNVIDTKTIKVPCGVFENKDKWEKVSFNY